VNGLFRGIVIVAGLLCAPALCAADEVVTFDSARYLVGSLQQRLARERGEPIKRRPADTIEGYLSKPAGAGPFPAIVHLHGCGGLSAQRRKQDSEQFTRWGYVTLMVDSFTTRGIKQACTEWPKFDRQLDALGALAYLAKLPFVDRKRIAVVGYSQGATTALEIASAQPVKLFDVEDTLKFKAAVAYYPMCSAGADAFAIPTLILIGEFDDWSLAAECRRMMKRQDGKGLPVKLVVFPEVYHDFDYPDAGIYGTRYFGHWLRYNSDATVRAAAMARYFLTEKLAN
jgi:dienelactone hydrolase